MLQDNCIIVLH